MTIAATATATTSINYKALCAEMVDELNGYKVAHPQHDTNLLDRARAALSTPSTPTTPVTPQPGEPTDREIEKLANWVSGNRLHNGPLYISREIEFARAVLNQWGK